MVDMAQIIAMARSIGFEEIKLATYIQHVLKCLDNIGRKFVVDSDFPWRVEDPDAIFGPLLNYRRILQLLELKPLEDEGYHEILKRFEEVLDKVMSGRLPMATDDRSIEYKKTIMRHLDFLKKLGMNKDAYLERHGLFKEKESEGEIDLPAS